MKYIQQWWDKIKVWYDNLHIICDEEIVATEVNAYATKCKICGEIRLYR